MSKDLLETVQLLADLLMQENDALKRLDFSAAVAVVPAKEAALLELTKQPKVDALAPPLVALGRLVGGLAAENQILLERAIAVQTRVVRIIARACAPAPAAVRYGATHGGRMPSRRAAAIALSTRA